MTLARCLTLASTLLLLAAPPALAAARPLWQGMAAGMAVTLTADDVAIGKPGAAKPALSLRRAFMAGIEPLSGGEETHDASWKLLSVVGPLVSVEAHAEGMAEGAAHPYGTATITAYDAARGGAVAKLTDYFPAGAIFTALMGDRLVQTALKQRDDDGPKPPRTLPQLLTAISGYQSDDCVWGFSDDLLSSFAFHHVAGDRVAVRFGLTHGCEVARGSLTILAVYLPIPPALKADLAAARTGRAGFLVPGAPKGQATFSLHVAGKPGRAKP